MKKFLALVLSLCLVLSLAACGGKTADDDTAEGSKTGGTIQAVSYTHLTLPTIA